MLAAMTHPSRVLNLDMKAKLCMPKSYICCIYIYIYIYIYIAVESREALLDPSLFLIIINNNINNNNNENRKQLIIVP